jgi:hypothetical protein
MAEASRTIGRRKRREGSVVARLPVVRRLLLTATVLVVTLAAATPTAQARPTLDCKSADLRYPFMPGGPKSFGVFKLQVTGGSCATAHRVAKAWMTKFEANIKAGSTRRPRSILGFTFTELTPNAAQTYRVRGRKGTTSIRFDYRVPNG